MSDLPSAIVEERRGQLRKKLRGHGQLLLPNNKRLSIRTIDLSASGIGIVSPVNLPANAAVLTHFAIPKKPHGATEVEIKATVSQSIFSHDEEGFKVSLRFPGVPSNVAQAFMAFLGD